MLNQLIYNLSSLEAHEIIITENVQQQFSSAIFQNPSFDKQGIEVFMKNNKEAISMQNHDVLNKLLDTIDIPKWEISRGLGNAFVIIS